MNDSNVLERMDALEQKLDLILEYVHQQRMQTEVVEDLVNDAVLIGKEVYNSSVIELEKQDIELDPDELKQLSINLVRNVHNFNELVSMLESIIDFKEDVTPIFNDVIIEFTKTLNKMEQKGYFEFAKELAHVMDTIVTNFTADDIRQLASNIVYMLQTVKNVTQPDMLVAINNAIKVYGSIQTEDIQPYSIWKMLRELKSPEMKSALGFMVAFMKNLSNQNSQSPQN